MNTEIREASNLILKSKYLIALTGAGISTPSGIPDFRSPNSGLWNRFDQTKIFDINFFHRHPEYFYDFAREFIFSFFNCEPNIAHNILAILEQKNILRRLITQNIDMLHQKAGNREVLELHGSPKENICLDCSASYTANEIIGKLTSQKVPLCDKCGGIIKPDITFFGEMLHENVIHTAFSDAEKADCCIVMGTSLVVYPAASIPEIVIRSGGKLVIVNRTQTHLDSYADFVFNIELDKFAREFLDILKEKSII